MQALVAFHVGCAGLWLGCLLTEILFERTLTGTGKSVEYHLARLHWRVDLFVELPALVAVVISGWMLLEKTPPSPVLAAKLAFAAVAVIANLWCTGIVFLRHAAVREDDWSWFGRLDPAQRKAGAVVLFGLLGAAALATRLS